MKRNYGSQVLWLVLPILLLVLYFVFVQPGPPPAPDVATEEAPGASEPAPPPAVEEESSPPQDEQLSRDIAFISQAFPLLSSWDLAELRPLLAAETLAGTSDEDFTEVLGVLASRLGELVSFDVPEPVDSDAGQTLAGDGSLQRYRFQARYEIGTAEVDLVLHRLPAAHFIYSFNINVAN